MTYQASTRDIDNSRVGSPSASNSLVFTENTRQWFIAVAVALSIAVNVICGVLLWNAYRAKEQTEDLKRYDLDFFKQNDWADMKARVLTNERIVNMMGACNQIKTIRADTAAIKASSP